MKDLKSGVITFLLGFLLLGLSGDLLAQNRAAAVQAFNKALELAKDNKFEQAINMYSQAISQAREAEEAGEKGQDIIERSQKQLPSLYFQIARSDYARYQKQKTIENIDAAIESFKQSSEIASEYENQQISSKSDRIITQLYYMKSVLQFQSKDFEASLNTLNKTIERNPNYALAYYQKGLVIKTQEGNTLEEFLELMDKAKEIAQETNNSTVVQKANESAAKELVFRGAKRTENKKYDEAVEILKRALEYDPENPNAHYRLAEAYNKRAMKEQAINHAQKALQFETGGKTDKAKIYFELGLAYKNQANQVKACQAFSNAAYGAFKSRAEHEMEYELECESTTN